MPECTFCGGNAFYLRPYSGEQLCTSCYVQAIEKQVQRTITNYKMLKPDDKVALALSGGKDSVSLLHILSRLEERFPKSRLVAVTIDEGIGVYRSEAVEIAKETCKNLGVEHHVYSFKTLYGCTLDEIADAAKQREKPFICSYCGILRRKALNLAARNVGGTKLATGHNLDDEVQSMMMNLLRGDVSRMLVKEENVTGIDLIPRIKPLCEVPEREVALYAFLKHARFQSLPCPYLETSLRNDVRKFLNTLEAKHSGMKFTLYRSFEKIRPQFKSAEEYNLNHCKVCGEPTTEQVCMACQILQELGFKSAN